VVQSATVSASDRPAGAARAAIIQGITDSLPR
jgi:hypothetical protein